jgi:hypothetical protein
MAYPVGEPAAKRRGVVSLRLQPSKLLVGPEDHELTHLDAVVTERFAQLVERRLDRRRLGDGVTTAFRGHGGVSVALVSHLDRIR